MVRLLVLRWVPVCLVVKWVRQCSGAGTVVMLVTRSQTAQACCSLMGTIVGYLEYFRESDKLIHHTVRERSNETDERGLNSIYNKVILNYFPKFHQM